MAISDLASLLSAKRDNCADMAQKAQSAFSTTAFQDSLTAQTEATRAQSDAQVYGVGHGGRETTQFLLARMQQSAADQAARAKANSDKLATSKQDVQQCVSDAEATGKSAFSDFKAAHVKHKPDVAEAESLTTAWLVNLDEISTEHPQGGDISKAAWASAKAHASLQ